MIANVRSLRAYLPKTGWLVQSGNARFKDNREGRSRASMNTSAEQTQASYKSIADLLAETKAALWINHDKPQSTGQKRSPQFYE